MVVSGERVIPGPEGRKHLQGQSAAVERSNGKRGLVTFEGEKKTNAQHV